MTVDFRKAVFELGNKVLEHQQSRKIRNVVCDQRKGVSASGSYEGTITGIDNEYLYFATSQGIQFLGYLLIDGAVDIINAKPYYRLKRLSEKQRCIIETAHQTITYFLDSCLKEFKEKYPTAYHLMDPYFLYQKPKLVSQSLSFLSEQDIEACVAAFKNGKLYKKIYNSENEMNELDNLDLNAIQNISDFQNKRFKNNSLITGVEIEDIVQNADRIIENKNSDTKEMLIILCHALKHSLETAAQLLYDAILGIDLLIMNNDNIIKLVEQDSDANFEKYVVLLQDIVCGISSDRLGSMALLICEPKDMLHIKEFGIIEALTISFDEFGSTTKVTMCTIDKELNDLHRLTDALLKIM